MQLQILSTHVQQYLQLFMHWNSNVWHSVRNLRILSPRIQKWQKRNPFCRCAFVNKKLSEGGCRRVETKTFYENLQMFTFSRLLQKRKNIRFEQILEFVCAKIFVLCGRRNFTFQFQQKCKKLFSFTFFLKPRDAFEALTVAKKVMISWWPDDLLMIWSSLNDIMISWLSDDLLMGLLMIWWSDDLLMIWWSLNDMIIS